MIEYPKTENLFPRNEDTHKLDMRGYRRPDFGQVGSWLVTEKIDGTNVRLVLTYEYEDPLASDDLVPRFQVLGRTSKATLPKNFIEEAVPGIRTALMQRAVEYLEHSGETLYEMQKKLRAEPIGMVVYGEGYGPGIQKGGDLAAQKSLRIFDVATFKYQPCSDGRAATVSRLLWRTWEDVEDVANTLGLLTVPVVMERSPTANVVAYVASRRTESYAARAAGNPGVAPEGVVARTDPYLFDYRGNRVMWKLKGKDIADEYRTP